MSVLLRTLLFFIVGVLLVRAVLRLVGGIVQGASGGAQANARRPNQPAAVSNFVQATTGISIPATSTNDPVAAELDKLMKADDAARAEVEKWIEDNEKFAEQGAGVPKEEMRRRIIARFAINRDWWRSFVEPASCRAANHELVIPFAPVQHNLGIFPRTVNTAQGDGSVDDERLVVGPATDGE